MNTGINEITYLSVIISEQGIYEKDSVLAPLFIPKSEINRIELVKGVGAERPLLGFLFGFGILAICFVFLSDLIIWFKRGGILEGDTLLSFAFLPLGFWLIFYALRKRFFLLVHTKSDERKVVFKGRVELKELSEFISRARDKFGYYII